MCLNQKSSTIMKKHLLLSLFATCLLFLSSSSQVFSKKDKLFGATAGIYFSNDQNNPSVTFDWRSSNIALEPSFAWAIKDNLAMGVKVGISYSRTANGAAVQERVQTGLQVGPEFFIRKYKILAKNFGVTFSHELNGYYYRTKDKNGPDIFRNSAWGTGYSFIPGAFYKFSDRFLGEANFGGLFLNYRKEGSRKSWSAAATFLTYLNIGFQYIIPSKKA